MSVAEFVLSPFCDCGDGLSMASEGFFTVMGRVSYDGTGFAKINSPNGHVNLIYRLLIHPNPVLSRPVWVDLPPIEWIWF